MLLLVIFTHIYNLHHLYSYWYAYLLIILIIIFIFKDHNARANSRTRTYTAFSREANSASRDANSASRNNTSRLGGNASRISNLQGSTSAKNRDDAPNPSSKRTSAGQPAPATYQHQASSSDGALMIKGIKKPSPLSGGVCNSNDLRRHSTGGKMVPKLEKTNQGLVAIDEKPFLVPSKFSVFISI